MIARKFVPLLLLSASLVAACAIDRGTPPRERLDHVILAISKLDEGVEQLRAVCGVTPIAGGKHAETGTENALLSLSADAYLEVLAPQDGAELPSEYQPLRAVTALLPVGWAVATRNADRTVAKLREAGYATSEPQAGSREADDGSVLRWRTFRLTSPKVEGAPFFIEWDAAVPHPAMTSPAGCSLVAIEWRTPHDEELRRLLNLLQLQGHVTRSVKPQLVLSLEGANGSKRLPAGL